MFPEEDYEEQEQEELESLLYEDDDDDWQYSLDCGCCSCCGCYCDQSTDRFGSPKEGLFSEYDCESDDEVYFRQDRDGVRTYLTHQQYKVEMNEG